MSRDKLDLNFHTARQSLVILQDLYHLEQLNNTGPA